MNLKKILVGAMFMASAAMAETYVVAFEPADMSVDASAECTTGKPGPDWVCVGGGWLPPGMTPPGGEPVAATSPAAQQAAPEPVVNSSGGGGQVRIMTWNIHFGEDGAAAQAREIANSGADVVLLQEAQTWDEHMPTTYPERLRQLTGQTWHTIWSEASNPSCGGGCQGTLILSRLPIVTHQTVSVSGTTATRAVIDVSGVHINVFNIHLEYYDTGKRSSQLVQFMDWMKQFGGPQIAGGDFNSWWGEWWIQQMETAFSDTWQDVTGSDEDGYTVHGTVRFDYLFRSHQDSWRITPTSAWVRWTGLSDHAQLVADYIVR